MSESKPDAGRIVYGEYGAELFSLTESHAEGAQTFSPERAKHELTVEQRRAKIAEDAKENEARRSREEKDANARRLINEVLVFFGLGVLGIALIACFIVGLKSKNEVTRQAMWAVVTIIIGGIIGGIAGYFAGKGA